MSDCPPGYFELCNLRKTEITKGRTAACHVDSHSYLMKICPLKVGWKFSRGVKRNNSKKSVRGLLFLSDHGTTKAGKWSTKVWCQTSWKGTNFRHEETTKLTFRVLALLLPFYSSLPILLYFFLYNKLSLCAHSDWFSLKIYWRTDA